MKVDLVEEESEDFLEMFFSSQIENFFDLIIEERFTTRSCSFSHWDECTHCPELRQNLQQ
ncbi:hypothetical protein A0J61_10564 [Choanephora cucurbitarum]|uniref:Uncharacterized protein n=1 Tax=Choanephora cucurbitarum TaxID=101091 RepID=A0A1C7MYA3_9FUNG|nr:hypothetical protein A0J61_10564 [Choanephora cucurbitarum]